MFKTILLFIKAILSGLIPFLFISLFLHMAPDGSLIYTISVYDVINLVNFILFIGIKYYFYHRSNKAKRKTDSSRGSLPDPLSNQFTTGQTPVWSKKTLDDNFSIIKLLAVNFFIYLFDIFILLWIIFRKVRSSKPISPTNDDKI